MTKVLVLYYSSYGHIEQMASAVAEGVREAGADIFTVALDAVTPEIFERTRGRGVDSPHRYDHYWRAIEWAAEVFGPERFGAHLICGMGETERELLEVAQRIRDLGGHNHMFAFFPERGSLMEDWPAVDRGQWRRVQLARVHQRIATLPERHPAHGQDRLAPGLGQLNRMVAEERAVLVDGPLRPAAGQGAVSTRVAGQQRRRRISHSPLAPV